MGRDISLATPDGPVNAWRADPRHGAAALCAIVMIQEIFGINAHIRGVVDGEAAAGYVALAPALFDPVERNFELAHDADWLLTQSGAGCINRHRARARQRARRKRCATGTGSPARRRSRFLLGQYPCPPANTRLGMPAVSDYGAQTLPHVEERLQAPMLFHFGVDDSSSSGKAIERHRAAARCCIAGAPRRSRLQPRSGSEP